MRNEGQVTTERRRHIPLISLDRAAKRNAVDYSLFSALGHAYGQLESESELRCGVLFAHGDHFCAGIDLLQFAPAIAQGGITLPDGALDPTGLYGPRLSKPVVSAIHGVCIGIGLEILLATDICIADTTTRFAQIEVKRGLYPAGGATIRFPRHTGWGNAMRYLLTGDEFNAEEALRIGLVQQVTAPGEHITRATELAETIAAQASLGVQATLASARHAITEGEEATVKYPTAKAGGFYDPVESWATCLSSEQHVECRVVVTISRTAAFAGMPALIEVLVNHLTTAEARAGSFDRDSRTTRGVRRLQPWRRTTAGIVPSQHLRSIG